MTRNPEFELPEETKAKLDAIAAAQNEWQILGAGLSGWDWILFPAWLTSRAMRFAWRRIVRRCA